MNIGLMFAQTVCVCRLQFHIDYMLTHTRFTWT